jgi:hypothetical protein
MKIPMEFSGLLLVVLFTGCSGVGRDSLDPLPPWKYSEMAAAVREGLEESAPEIRDLRLLAWQGMIDDRPVHVEKALFWVKLSSRRIEEQWALVQIGRNPNRTDYPDWDLYIVNDVPWEPVKFFGHPPDNAEVGAFLQFWEFEPRKPWRLLTSGLRERTWKYAMGERPPESYRAKLSNFCIWTPPSRLRKLGADGGGSDCSRIFGH